MDRIRLPARMTLEYWESDFDAGTHYPSFYSFWRSVKSLFSPAANRSGLLGVLQDQIGLEIIRRNPSQGDLTHHRRTLHPTAIS
jgi:hypothetical protein